MDITDDDFNRFLQPDSDNDSNEEEIIEELDKETLMETLYSNLLDNVRDRTGSLQKKKQDIENFVSDISDHKQKQWSVVYAVLLSHPELLTSTILPLDIVSRQFNELYYELPTNSPLRYFTIVELAFSLGDMEEYNAVFKSPTAWNRLKFMDRSEGAKVQQIINFIENLYEKLDRKLKKKCSIITDYKYNDYDAYFLTLKDILAYLDKNPVYNDLRLCGIIQNAKRDRAQKRKIESGDREWVKQKTTFAFKSPQEKRIMDRRKKQLDILPLIEQDTNYFEEDFAPTQRIYDSDYEDYFQNALENPEQYYNLFSDPESDDDLLSSIEFGDPKMFMSSLWNRNRYPFKKVSKKKKTRKFKKRKDSVGKLNRKKSQD